MKKFTKRVLSKQLALAGLLGASTFVFQGEALATDYGSLTSSTITLSNGDVVTADTVINSFLTGINNANSATASINLGSGSKVIASRSGTAVSGINLEGANSTLNANGLIIEAKGSTARGLYVIGSKDRVELGTGGSITVEGTSVRGLYVSSASSVNADHIVINTKGSGYGVDVEKQGSSVNLGSGSSITTNGGTAIMIFGANGNAADGVARFTASGLTVDTQGHAAYGVNVQKNSIADLGSGSLVTTHGADSSGVLVYGEFKANDGLNITTTGTGDSIALQVRTGGKATVGANSHLRAEQAGGLLVSEANSVIDFKGTATARNTIFSSGSYGASSQNSGTVNLENTDITVDRNGSTAYAVWAAGGVVNAKNTTVTGASGVSGVVATNSSAYFTGDTAVTMASADQVAMISDGAGHLISGIGKMNITGGVYAQSNATTDLQMTQGSILTGGAFASSGGTTNLSLDGSRWDMTKDSLVSKLALNNSTVNFAENKTGSILNVGDLSGNGTFIMQVDMVGDGVTSVGDKLVVTGTSAGNHRITAQNRGSLATTGNEVLTVVETPDGAAAFAMTNKVELGGYLYDIRRATNNNDWELYSSGKYTPAVITPTADVSANFLNAGYLLNYAETQTLLQRMGDLRQGENSEGDVWARAYTGKFDSFGGGKLSGFDMDYTGVQAGADKRFSVERGDLYLGVMGGVSQADPNYVAGDGDLTGYHLGMYSTYVMDNDFYVDGVLKYNHLKNKFNNVQDTQGNLIDGDASSDGYGVSVEVGKRFYWNGTRSGYYIEPQAQLSYTHQGSATTRASNGLVTEMDSYDSTIGRISGLIGYEIKDGANPVNVYFKTGYVTEMSGDAGYSLNGSKEHNDFGGDWWENGIGVTAQINKKHNLYLDGKYATGSKFDQMQINAGYRYSF